MTDLFNPTFFMFLGILLLAIAIVVVYFESKSREQNHKIASMLSIVSTLAEDMDGVKMRVHHLSTNQDGGNNLQPFSQHVNSSLEETGAYLFQNNNDNLINVSDDESDDDESDDGESDDDESDDDESDDGATDDGETDGEDNHANIKILKVDDINDIDCEEIDSEEIDSEEIDSEEIDCEEIDSEEIDILEELNEMEDPEGDSSNNKSVLELLSTPNDDSNVNILATDLKTININLEEPLTDSQDYKKFAIPKLRSLVAEKNLSSSSDVSKLKKWELIKLLEEP